MNEPNTRSIWQKRRQRDAGLAFGEILTSIREEPMELDKWMAKNEETLTERALVLADIASDMIWGGERGWEAASDEQFAYLVKTLRGRLRKGL